MNSAVDCESLSLDPCRIKFIEMLPQYTYIVLQFLIASISTCTYCEHLDMYLGGNLRFSSQEKCHNHNQKSSRHQNNFYSS